MVRIKINNIESASFVSKSYLNDLQELEMTSVKGGWVFPLVRIIRWGVVLGATSLLSSSSGKSNKKK